MKKEHPTLSRTSVKTLASEKKIRRRIRNLYLVFSVLASAVILAVLAMFFDWSFSLQSKASRFILSAAALIGFVASVRWIWNKMTVKNHSSATAQWLDEVNPDLQERLTTSVELQGSGNHSPELLKAVGRQVDAIKIKSGSGQMMKSRSFTWASTAFAGAFVLLFALVLTTGQSLEKLWDRLIQPWNENTLTVLSSGETTTYHPRGEDFVIATRISGKIPAEAKIQERSPDGIIEERWVEINEERNNVVSIVPNASRDFEYRIEAGDSVTPWQKVIVIDKPVIAKSEFVVTPPAYTKLPKQVLSKLPRQLKLPEGSQVQLTFQADQELSQAQLQKRTGGQNTTKTLEPDSEGTYGESYQVLKTTQNTIRLTSIVGDLTSRTKINLVAIPDKAPKVRLSKESQTFAMKDNEELDVQFEAVDDYGIQQAELVAKVEKADGTKEEFRFPVDLKDQAGNKKVQATAKLDLSKLPIEKDSKVSYSVKVKDTKGMSSAKTSEVLAKDELQKESLELKQLLQEIKDLEKELMEARKANEELLQNPEAPLKEEQKEALTNEAQDRLKNAEQKLDKLTQPKMDSSALKEIKERIKNADQKLEASKIKDTPRSDQEESKSEIEKAQAEVQKLKNQIQKEIDQNAAEQNREAREKLEQQKADLLRAAANIKKLQSELDQARSSNQQAIADQQRKNQSQDGKPQNGQQQGNKSQNGQSQKGQQQANKGQNGQSQNGKSQEGQQQGSKSQDGKQQGNKSQSGQSQGNKSQSGQSQEGQQQGNKGQNGQSEGGKSQKSQSQNSASQGNQNTQQLLQKAQETAKGLSEGAEKEWQGVNQGIEKAQNDLSSQENQTPQEQDLLNADQNIQDAQDALNQIAKEVEAALQGTNAQLNQQAQMQALQSALTEARNQASDIRQSMAGQPGQQSGKSGQQSGQSGQQSGQSGQQSGQSGQQSGQSGQQSGQSGQQSGQSGQQSGQSGQQSGQANLQEQKLEDLSDQLDELKGMANQLQDDDLKGEVADSIQQAQDAIDDAKASPEPEADVQKAEDEINKALDSIAKAQGKQNEENNRPDSVPPKQDEVEKRSLDVSDDQQQSQSQSAQVTVDEHENHLLAGDGRKKKQIAIQEVLDQIKESAEKGRMLIAAMRYEDFDGEKKNPHSDENLILITRPLAPRLIALLKTGIEQAEALQKESEDTPYSFFGLQSKAMVENGFAPSIKEMEEAMSYLTPETIITKTDSIDERLRWILALLKKTGSQLDQMIKMEEIADLSYKFKKMHELTVEDMPPPGGT